jgi:hypothetical protein
LNVTDEKNQEGEQYQNLNYIVDEKLQAEGYSAFSIHTEEGEQASDPSIEPTHTQHLILKEIEYH